MQRHSAIGLVISPAFYWYVDGIKKPQPMTLPSGVVPPGSWLPRLIESNDNAACPSAVLMRKELAIAVGGFVESFRGPLMTVEDQVMWFKTTMNAAIYYLPLCLILYRIHSASCSLTTSSHDRLQARVDLYAWLTQYLNNANSRPPQSKLFGLMAEYSLCSASLRLQIHAVGKWSDRYRMTADLRRIHADSLGPVSSRLLAMGCLFPRTSWVLATGMVIFAVFGGVTVREGLPSGVNVLGRYLVRMVRRLTSRRKYTRWIQARSATADRNTSAGV
jgi:hypothetical protein